MITKNTQIVVYRPPRHAHQFFKSRQFAFFMQDPYSTKHARPVQAALRKFKPRGIAMKNILAGVNNSVGTRIEKNVKGASGILRAQIDWAMNPRRRNSTRSSPL